MKGWTLSCEGCLYGVGKVESNSAREPRGRTSRDHHSLSNWSRVCRDKKHLGRSRTAPPEFSSRETCCHTSRKLGASPQARGCQKFKSSASVSVSAMAPVRSTHCATSTQYPRACSIRETTGSVYNTSHEADTESNGKGVDVRGAVVNLLVEKIASDRNRSVTMMNLVEELLAPDDVLAYLGVLLDKVQTERYSSLSMIRRLALTS
jgi:hypothetical protein